MAADVVRYVNPLSTAGGDGTTDGTAGATRAFASTAEVLAWLGTTYTDLTISDVRVIIRLVGRESVNTAFAWPSLVTDATRYVQFEPHTTPHVGAYSATADGWDYTSASLMAQPGMRVRIVGLVTNYTGTSVNSGGILSSAAVNGTHLTFERCIRRRNPSIAVVPSSASPYAAASCIYVSATSGTAVVVQSVACLDVGPWAFTHSINRVDDVASRVVAYNCTAVDVWGGVITTSNATAARLFFANNRVERRAGSTFDCFALTVTPTGRNDSNASDDATSPTVGLRNLTGTYVDAAGGDYTPTTGDAGVDEGVDLSGDATFPFSADLVGTTWVAPWDIGARQAASAPASAIAAISSGYHLRGVR